MPSRDLTDESFDEFIDQNEAADLLRVTPPTLKSWRSTGKGPPYYKVGRRCLYRKEDLLQFMLKCVKKPA